MQTTLHPTIDLLATRPLGIVMLALSAAAIVSAAIALLRRIPRSVFFERDCPYCDGMGLTDGLLTCTQCKGSGEA